MRYLVNRAQRMQSLSHGSGGEMLAVDLTLQMRLLILIAVILFEKGMKDEQN